MASSKDQYYYQNNTSATRQARVVINTYLDRNEMQNRRHESSHGTNIRAYDAPVEDRVLGVDILDLVFMKKDNDRSTIRDSFKLDDYPHVFSSGNGMYVSEMDINIPIVPNEPEGERQEKKRDQAKKICKENIVFVGVADTRDDFTSGHDDQHIARTGVTVQIGGVHTIRNTGMENIRQFDWVCWDMPRIDRQAVGGIDHDKLLFQTKPYRVTKVNTAGEYATAFDEENARRVLEGLPGLDADDAARFEFSKKIISGDQGFVIGKALSSAVPGQEFDLFMGRYSV